MPLGSEPLSTLTSIPLTSTTVPPADWFTAFGAALDALNPDVATLPAAAAREVTATPDDKDLKPEAAGVGVACDATEAPDEAAPAKLHVLPPIMPEIVLKITI